MTYFGFLLLFLCVPLTILIVLTIYKEHRKHFVKSRTILIAIALHVVLALIYTTPWDNYLVATGVWYYNPKLVTGIVLGYVPLEEYSFFVLQTMLTGLWWWWLARQVENKNRSRVNRNAARSALGWILLIWLGSIYILLSKWNRGTYLGLELAWALPPITSQLLFGGDILWHHRRLVATTIISITTYLSIADSFAISSGTWMIAPAQSTNIFISALPLEELIFFLLTNTLIVFGITLLWADESRARASQFRQWVALKLGSR